MTAAAMAMRRDKSEPRRLGRGLGITRQTLYRFVSPTGELRDDAMSSSNVELPQSQRQNHFKGETQLHPNREGKHINHRHPKPSHFVGKANASRGVRGTNNGTAFGQSPRKSSAAN